MSWQDLEQSNPELAAYGQQRLHGNVGYLATTRPDGAPRVHPITPQVGQGHLFVFMEPTSPKGKDLQRDPRYSLHCSMSDSTGESGEFWCSGRATLVQDAETRALAVQLCSYTPADRYVLFELDVDRAQSTNYENGSPVRTRWNKDTV